jgi:hypothetical protein
LSSTVLARETAGTTDSDIQAFRRITGEGDRPDGLDQTTFERYQRLALWLYYQNPLARRLMDVPTDMVLGAGVNIDVEKVQNVAVKGSDDVKKQVTRFLEHPSNEFDVRLPGHFTMLNVGVGELFLPAFVAPQNGDVALGFLEHHLVQEVIFNPKNRMEALAVIQRAPDGTQKPLYWNVIRAEQGQDQPMFPKHPDLVGKKGSVDREIVTDNEIDSPQMNRAPKGYIYAGEIFYFRANVLGTGRGRSAIEPTLDWLHAYDNFLFGDLRNAGMQAAFIWDVEITGADHVTLTKRANEIRQNPPRPGEVNFHNEKEKWQALSPNLNAASHTDLGVQVKKIIGLALGLPPHLIGAENDTTRTSSVSSDTPFVRRMEQKQKVLHYFVKTILDYQLDQKVYAGMLKAERPYPYRVVLPSLTAGEIVALAESMLNITSALETAMAQGITSLADARRLWYALGVQEADIPEGLAKQVEEERKAGLLSDPVALKKEEMALKAAGPAGPPGADGKARTLRAKTKQGGPSAASRGK